MAYAVLPSSADMRPDVVPGKIRETVGLFTSSDALQATIRHLEGTSFPRHDISVMGNETDLEKVFGTPTPNSNIAADIDLTPRTAPSRPEEQTIGAAAAIGGGTYIGAMALALAAGAVTFPAILGAVILGGASGAAAGAVLTKLMGDRYTHHIEDQIRHGGILLWVQTPDQEKEELAATIMQAHGGQNIHVHDIH